MTTMFTQVDAQGTPGVAAFGLVERIGGTDARLRERALPQAAADHLPTCRSGKTVVR